MKERNSLMLCYYYYYYLATLTVPYKGLKHKCYVILVYSEVIQVLESSDF